MFDQHLVDEDVKIDDRRVGRELRVSLFQTIDLFLELYRLFRRHTRVREVTLGDEGKEGKQVRAWLLLPMNEATLR